jgi:hypothetical protein
MTRSMFLGALVALAFTAAAHADQGEPPGLFIEGYAGQVSYKPTQTLTLHVSTSAPKFSLEIVRLGAKREVVLAKSDLDGTVHKVPENASSHGCEWPASFQFPLPATWKSGYYQVVLKAQDKGGLYVQRNKRTAESECFFVLRPEIPGKNAKILLQLCTNTYSAYNNWGGFSLYAFNARAKVQGHRVSFQRPPASQFSRWELPFVVWAENNGYALDYAANLDLEDREGNGFLQSYRLVLSVGHDEYWSAGMRDRLEQFIDNGGNVAFFSGNTCCWQVRPEDNNNALVSYKQRYNQDPFFRTQDHRQLATLWSHHLVGRPENSLTGVGFLWGGYHRSHDQFMDGPGAYTVHRPEHWIFAGANLKKGDKLGGKNFIVGYECDGCEMVWKDGLPYPTHRDGTPKSFTILGTCPAKWHPDDCLWYERFEKDRVGNAVLGVYEKNGVVFTCGATDWSRGLQGNDAAVERITKNVLDRLSK